MARLFFCASLVVLISALPGTGFAEERLLMRHGELAAHVPTAGWCGPEVHIRVHAPHGAYFTGDKVELQQLIGGLRAVLPMECPSFRTMRVSGIVAGELTYTGLVSEATGGQLADQPVAAADDASERPPSDSMRADISHDRAAVRRVQELLAEFDYNPGPADGLTGPRTRAAVRAFQSGAGLPVDGVVSRELIADLEATRAERAATQEVAAPEPSVEAQEAVTPAEPEPARIVADTTAAGTSITPRRASPDDVHACDLLAAWSFDEHAVAKMVELEDMDGVRAFDACRRARAEFPEVPRFAYQEARALIKLERYGEAVALLRELADREYVAAQYSLGWLHQQGKGVPRQDMREALSWYRKAAEKGLAPAQAVLGHAYAEGQGGQRRNDQEALRWFRAAADQGEPYARAWIGYMHEAGRGVPIDTAQALAWYRSAAEDGNTWALEQVERFDPAGARAIREQVEQKAQARLAEQRERQRQADALLAADYKPAIVPAAPVASNLVEAIEDLAWTVAAKIDADVRLVAGALTEASLSRPREESEAVALGAKQDGEGGTADPEQPMLLIERLAARTASGAAPHALVDRDQTRLMLEVAALYEQPEERDGAVALYLRGFRDLASPVSLPSWVDGDSDGPLRGVQAVADHLRGRLEQVVAELEQQQAPEGEALDDMLARVMAATETVAQAQEGSVEVTLREPAASINLGSLAALEATRRASGRHKDVERAVLISGEVRSTPLDGLQLASVRFAFSLVDGGELGAVDLPVVLPQEPPVPEVTTAYRRTLDALPSDLAGLMLASLPVELANLAWFVEDVAAELRAAVGLSETVAWQPRIEVASVAADTKERSADAPALDEAAVAVKAALPTEGIPAAEPIAEEESSADLEAAVEPLDTEEPEVTEAAAASGKEIAVARTEATTEAPAVERSPSGTQRTAEVKLVDGSTIMARLVAGTLTVRSALGELPVAVEEIVAFSDGALRLADGMVLRGEIVSGEIVIATRFGEHSLAASEIDSFEVVDD